MKALIIYDDFASGVKASATVLRAARRAKVGAFWSIRPWRVDILRCTAAANEALMEAVDADLIVLAGHRVYSLPAWLKEWLESWDDRRQAGDCALVVVREETDGKGFGTQARELSRFAERHGLDFIVLQKEEGRVAPSRWKKFAQMAHSEHNHPRANFPYGKRSTKPAHEQAPQPR